MRCHSALADEMYFLKTDPRPRYYPVDEREQSGSLTPTNARFHDTVRGYSLSSEDAETVVRWQTPPESRMRTPDISNNHIYTPIQQQTPGTNAEAEASRTHLVRFDEDQIRSTQVEAERRSSRMEEALEDTPPTPTMDDTPYIRFAIEQLTIDKDMSYERSSRSTEPPRTPLTPRTPMTPRTPLMAVEYNSPDVTPNYVSPEREREAMRLVRKHRSTPSADGRLFNFNATQPLPLPAEPEPAVPVTPRISAIFIPVDLPPEARHPPLDFVPTVLRPPSMITLALLCLGVTGLIMFCAIYSTRNEGLFEWRDGIYGGRYFLFGFLPQILAALVSVYVQVVMAAMTRILPFIMMANEDEEHRAGALFLGIFPRSLLFPRWEGPLSFEIAHSVFWLSIFTIPLASSLFSVALVNDTWRWTTVQGVAWVLVGIYMLMFLATLTFGVFFFRRTTGLLWDPVSLADIMSMLPRSNCFNDYAGTDVMSERAQLKERLASRADRLGYWRTQNKNQGMFYCLGEHGAENRRRTMSSSQLLNAFVHNDYVVDLEKRSKDFTNIRFRHLPWFIRDTYVILWLVAAVVLLTALFVVSFLPQTAIRKGFPASTTVVPNSTGFSAANFLYSFIPSTIGTLLYICFLSIDMVFRKRQTWASLSAQDGVPASTSLLLDYPSRLPISCTIAALKNGHYRVAILSLSSFLFLALPILAGGVFFPLSTSGRTVRLFPNLTAYYIILALLTLYLIGLVLIIPSRRKLALPHEADCVAEIISFVYASGALEDAPFRAPKSKEDLRMRLNAVGARGEGKTFGFGVVRDRNGKEVLNVDRVGRPGNGVIVLDPKRR